MTAFKKQRMSEVDFKEGVTDFSLHAFPADSLEVRINKGQVYLMDHDNEELIELKDVSYTDFIHSKDVFVLSTFAKIDIYQGLNFLVEYRIDDIDGIRLKKVQSDMLHGEFRQIQDREFDNWLPFKIDLTSLDFECDHGRMWIETRLMDGVEKEYYRTMDLNK